MDEIKKTNTGAIRISEMQQHNCSTSPILQCHIQFSGHVVRSMINGMSVNKPRFVGINEYHVKRQWEFMVSVNDILGQIPITLVQGVPKL